MTAGGTCSTCGARAGPGQRFCTRCGASLGPAPPAGESGGRAEPAAGAAAPALVACPACGGVNAASRRSCGRCDLPLHERTPAASHAPVLPLAPAPGGGAIPVERDSTGPLVIATALAALVVAVVVVSLLQQRNTAEGLPAPSAQRVAQQVGGVSASSWLPPSGSATYGPRNLVDGDPSTAWNEAADGPGTGEWVELRLAESAEVTRLVIWNGHQKGELFGDNARVRALRIELGSSSFTAQLLDARGPQAVDLPQPVRSDTVRLTVQDIYPGVRYDDGALSEVEVRALRSS